MVLEVEVALDDSDVVVEETGVAMVGGEEDVGVVDACVEFPLDGGREDSGGAVVGGASLEFRTTWWAPSHIFLTIFLQFLTTEN